MKARTAIFSHLFLRSAVFSTTVLGLCLGQLLLSVQPVFAQADSPTIADFDSESDSCSASNPASCNCTYLFRNETTGEILGAIQGGTEQDSLGGTLTILPPGVPVEWAVLAYADPSEQKDDCYAEQQESSPTFDEETYAKDAAAGCIAGTVAGAVVPLPGVTCGTGAGVAFVADGGLGDSLDNLWNGQWNGMGDAAKSDHPVVAGSDSCGWNDENYTVTRWTHVSGSFDSDKFTKLQFQGKSGGLLGVGDVLSKDDFYCGLLAVKNTNELLSRHDGNTSIGGYYAGAGGPLILCEQIKEGTPERDACESCAAGGGSGDGGSPEAPSRIWTGVGCISLDVSKGIGELVIVALGIAGGIALISILAAGFIFSTSHGDPQKTTKAKELLQNAIIGLLFILFSVTMLQFVARDIFRIPGFGG